MARLTFPSAASTGLIEDAHSHNHSTGLLHSPHLLRRGLESKDFHNLAMKFSVERIGLRPPIQICQTFSHVKPALFQSFAACTVWTVDSQKGQQVAF
jgi:hypothetical protein